MLIEIVEASQAGEARRRAVACAEDLQMGEARCGEVGLVTTEIATNLVKHAVRGHILLQGSCEDGSSSLRVMGVDKGPGIANISQALSDGHSTAGSMGSGLGAIRRLSTSFDLYSVPGSGTVVSAEFSNAKRSEHRQPVAIEVGVVSEPIAGESECGDGWGIRRRHDGLILMVVDGLGHGVLAAEAAREAEEVLKKTKEDSVTAILQTVHGALKKTRGAAAAVVKIEPQQGIVRFAGIGNVSGSIVAPGSSRGLASHNGTLGQSIQRVQEFTYPWTANSVLVMHSDGLASRWDLDRYPGIWGKHPCVAAAILHRDFSRNRDDVTVLVAKAVQTRHN
jgi:anti-sigma regulatory factor (Ser/Thr protein kinase)